MSFTLFKQDYIPHPRGDCSCMLGYLTFEIQSLPLSTLKNKGDMIISVH